VIGISPTGQNKAGRSDAQANRHLMELATGLSRQFRSSSDQPLPFVDIELHQTFAAHFQQQGLACFLIPDIGAFHDFIDLERLLAKRAQDIFSITRHD
jgi:hypothetical protein